MDEKAPHDSRQTDVTFRLFELITDMDFEEQMNLLEELEKKQTRKTRKHKRRNTHLTVYYATHDRAYRDVIQNISPTGVFIETSEPFNVGQEILLNFTPTRHAEPVKVRGQVVRLTDEGIGVKFIRPATKR
ncbi:MAG: PilZ domain-containing protein [Desulfobacterales bacterium]|nr:PilZ domain-containing protein [Desulfobacterales bacterium]MDJ0873679.1 PilZ domain-containing protein [Desulfobacterales bacterium]